MTKRKYAIYGMYSFQTMCDDSPRGSLGPEEYILIKLTHDDAMEMGERFKNERPGIMEFDSDMDIIERVRRKMVRDDGYSEEESWQFQVFWSDGLINDCVQYYDTHHEHQYAIDGYYDFGTVADGARPSACGQSGIHLQFNHDDVMEMGEYFLDEDPYELDVDYNFGIKDELDEILADNMAAELEEEWEEENGDDQDAERPDFYEQVYDRMSEMYHCWDEDFKQDCINYYLAHKKD